MPDTDTVTVRRATSSDAGPLIAVLAEAFHDGPVANWLIPDPTDRRVVLYRYFKNAFHHGLTHGHIDTTTNLSAVAIWYPRLDPPPQGHTRERQEALEHATGPYAPKFTLMEAMFDAFHPDEPHHHLAYLAVDPEHQNQGIGAALLHEHHQQLDKLGLPAYLEATNTRNRQLYHRLGYTPGPPLILPTQGLPIWRMWRGQHTPTGRAPFPPNPQPQRRTR
ncbi:GNAT family N-acetyltransferase [Micromonospora sp. HUAS LYJ1]|uniref:GNAT family N-acetyltransferase n=1 Tax=Micromonospora sp. HUAS LYJ1 TaxID=3061626 RepID=UPI0026722F1F|nr:GNAT family N-acetyltransferase [Micromonospora sp. HUAS LYJ1]WKU03782.1 GNAT family N-acetyltransferase [Micromonospora sp. HUAS LYJ1]WKU07072.1 GNAT family N-acetyltransferase [Micromonospora sp. HUAS LYJ1]